jgi:hypothetical protein
LTSLDTSEASKEHSQQVLDSIPGDGNYSHRDDDKKDPTRVAAGLKAAINNPGISKEGKEQAQKKLDDLES